MSALVKAQNFFKDEMTVTAVIDGVSIVTTYRRLWARVAKGVWMLIDQEVTRQ